MSNPGRIAFRNAALFDSRKGVLRPNATVIVEGERIAAVEHGAVRADAAVTYDLAGKTLLPGLIDAHVHVTAVDHDVHRLALRPPSLITAQAKDVLEGMLGRGFTTVRDAAGADFGLQEAVERGLFAGPRLFIAGWPLTQTGGHGDVRPRGARSMICTCAGLGLFGAVADGVGEVRRAAREQLRNGANHIKVMAGGGVIEPAARAMKECGAYLVPTLATYAALAEEADSIGLAPLLREKLERVRNHGVNAIRIARAVGVPIAFGTDLLGRMHARQATEYALRLPAMTPVEILQSATSIAAELMNQSGKLGVVEPGACADLLVTDGDPTRDLSPLQVPEKGLLAVMKSGRFYINRLTRVGADPQGRSTRA